jgi:hypothetical protein
MERTSVIKYESPRHFTSWGGYDGIENFIKARTGCNPFSGAGINPRVEKRTTILKSVRGTPYYSDDLIDPSNPKYTLFGHYGDQDMNEKRFNEPLMNPNKTEHIYLYESFKNGSKTEYLWFGEYRIDGYDTQRHHGKDMIPRDIVVLSLKKKI